MDVAMSKEYIDLECPKDTTIDKWMKEELLKEPQLIVDQKSNTMMALVGSGWIWINSDGWTLCPFEHQRKFEKSRYILIGSYIIIFGLMAHQRHIDFLDRTNGKVFTSPTLLPNELIVDCCSFFVDDEWYLHILCNNPEHPMHLNVDIHRLVPRNILFYFWTKVKNIINSIDCVLNIEPGIAKKIAVYVPFNFLI